MPENAASDVRPKASSGPGPEAGTIIVGGGHAGRQAALALREGGYRDRIVLVDQQDDPLYERPPLSKGFLRGEEARGSLFLRPRERWHELGVEMVFRTRALALDAHRNSLTTDSGEYGFQNLIWAAGGSARSPPLPGFDAPSVGTLRTIDDAVGVKQSLDHARRLVIVGGGYIGLEVAASARALGIQVTLLEAQERVLARVTSETVSAYFQSLHRSAGVRVELSCSVERAETGPGEAVTVHLADGAAHPADAVLVGVGIAPNTAVLAEAGATIANGVEVDEDCRTSLPGIFAIGDCASRPHPGLPGSRLRLESVPNAVETANIAAAAILGRDAPRKETPWFWSHQYDVKLQSAGALTEYDERILRGTPDSGKFSVLYLRDQRLIALDTVGRVGDFAAGRKLIGSYASAPAGELANPETPLRRLFH